ncbi:MAG TPA: fumarylacetoacetate hydrolase family protein [Steroidobacteraceae bacterium]|nr:fumarylacetoacetate hydrolase family protein [Steroidobacteraceae bacterium]
MIRVYATAQGMVLEQAGTFRQLPAAAGFDELFRADDPSAWLNERLAGAPAAAAPAESALLAPIQSQEVWAAGVTYLRSMTARMEEAREAGGGNFYDRVYNAARPELFFKATPQRVIGPGGKVRIRSDSKWNVPEPELTLAINSAGRIFGFSVGNDMSSRDIEGENPLYLPQAKTYAGSAGLGPCLVVTDQLPSADTAIVMTILRGGAAMFSGETHVGRIKRPLPSLAEYLFRDNNFPSGAWLMTGTGIVPPDAFTLDHGDEIRITIEPAGTLRNTVA